MPIKARITIPMSTIATTEPRTNAAMRTPMPVESKRKAIKTDFS